MTEETRPYHSPARRRQAAETRRHILASARRLFVERGYGGATVEAIADGAGVAAPTVYASLGSKRGILMGLLDEMAADADREGMEEKVAAAAGDPRRQLRERIAFNVRFYAGGADLIDIARTVSGVERDLAEMWEEGEGRRYRATRSLVAEWDEAGALAEGVDAGRAVDVMWSLTGPDVFRLFVVKRGWSRDRYEAWLGDTLEGLLLGEVPDGGAR
ncbi:MAG: TetR/AcrR family transcriptional regulator [Candidatus Palauibacterales bacterium]|nr:TetR/AcrR family transcriptional regulator [Candidatus Palauibacterales bacterium]MDP2584997.1 TetR/AcrR family transcriptional regulator [Candidatus Palauibacterales bacterium]